MDDVSDILLVQLVLHIRDHKNTMNHCTSSLLSNMAVCVTFLIQWLYPIILFHKIAGILHGTPPPRKYQIGPGQGGTQENRKIHQEFRFDCGVYPSPHYLLFEMSRCTWTSGLTTAVYPSPPPTLNMETSHGNIRSAWKVYCMSRVPGSCLWYTSMYCPHKLGMDCIYFITIKLFVCLFYCILHAIKCDKTMCVWC